MRTLLKSTVGILTLASVIFGQAATAQAPLPEEPFEKQIRKSVAFIHLVCEKGRDTFDVKGTGFFLSYHDERFPDGSQFMYFITNRHVAECWDSDDKPMHVKSASIRFNHFDGSSPEEAMNPTGNLDWIIPKDDSVDLALLPLIPNRKVIDYRAVPFEMLANEEMVSRDVFEGQKIMFAGFFYQFAGEKKMQPIVREGILAMVPDEVMETINGKQGKLYLGDIHIFHGNSGSPVFVNVGGTHGNRILGDRFLLLGVVSSMFYEDQDLQLHIATTLEGKLHANSGIAAIVPATAVEKLVSDPRVKHIRDQKLAQLNTK